VEEAKSACARWSCLRLVINRNCRPLIFFIPFTFSSPLLPFLPQVSFLHFLYYNKNLKARARPQPYLSPLLVPARAFYLIF